ncbi:11819_t:CDS:2 [Scutellospora calospora]|uniref:11819_t:CDS:1 n=1 Tax=Scutellospora calospora TaxID=85575 RepID=A0ACA9KNI8_9GLOM|nr:11819_t:CDS:2 [Scutellospora calospora]
MQLGRLTPKWFEEFKKNWNQLVTKLISNNTEERYIIDLDCWVYYPFLIWNSSKPNNILLRPNFDSKIQSKIVFIANGDNETIDPELNQQYKAKVDELKYLVNHLKEELSINNI